MKYYCSMVFLENCDWFILMFPNDGCFIVPAWKVWGCFIKKITSKIMIIHYFKFYF